MNNKMSKATGPIVTIVTIIIAICFHPSIESWPKFTAKTLVIVLIAVSISLIFYFRKEKDKALYAGVIAGLIGWQYLMISAFSYIRIFDDIMNKPLKDRIACLVACIVFLIYSNWLLKKTGIISNEEEDEEP